jgi:hypothetical protein
VRTRSGSPAQCIADQFAYLHVMRNSGEGLDASFRPADA